MIRLKIRKVGNSLGLVLPKEAANRMSVTDGDPVFLTEAPDGSYTLTPYDPEFDQQMEIAEEGMRQYRNTLRTLSK